MNVDDVVRVLKACGEGKAACAQCPWEKLHGEECHFAKSRAAAELIELLQAENERLREAGRILPEGFRCCMSSDEKTLYLFHDNPTHRVKSSVTKWLGPSESEEVVDWTKNKKCRRAVLRAFGGKEG